MKRKQTSHGLDLVALVLLVITALASECHNVFAAIQEESEEAPFLQFFPKGTTEIASKLEVYPVVVIAEKPFLKHRPLRYVSFYIRDCAGRYRKAQLTNLEIQLPNGSRVRFKVDQSQDGIFTTPKWAAEGITDDLLTDQGRKMLRTKETYFLAEPIRSEAVDLALQSLDSSMSLLLTVQLSLDQSDSTRASLKQSFRLEGKRTRLRVFGYGDDNNPRPTLIVPEVSVNCAEDASRVQ